MTVRDMTFTDADRCERLEADGTVFAMDETAFRLLHERTARPLWVYLFRATGDAHRADDLLQETYYRFLRHAARVEDAEHQRNYLFRVAMNLVRDHRRRPGGREVALPDDGSADAPVAAGDAGTRAAARTDVWRAMAQMTPRERDLLWLAYAEGSSHREIAEVAGVKEASVRTLLSRARRRLARLLGRTQAGAHGPEAGGRPHRSQGGQS